jgi:cytochrome c556
MFAAPALAQEGQGAIDYRQKVMSAHGADMGAIGDILKNQLPVQGNIEGHAASLVLHADLIAAAFGTRVTDGPTDAKPGIWEDTTAWEEAISAFRAEAEAMLAAAKSGDMAQIGGQMRPLGQSCGGCHKKFRKPKEESYKNR